MQIEIKIDEAYKDPKVMILTNKITDEVNELLKKLSDTQPQTIAGFKDGSLKILQPNEIIRVFTENQKV